MILQSSLSKFKRIYASFFNPFCFTFFIALTIIVHSYTANAYAAQVKLSWFQNKESDLAGYNIHYGTSRGIYDTTIDVGNQTSYIATGLISGNTYYFAISAYNANGNESAYSGEVYKVPTDDTTGGGPIDDSLTKITTIIDVGDIWNYFKGYSHPGTGWNGVSFNDSNWDEGPTGIGVGDDDDSTILSDMRYNYLTVYTRKTFDISNTSTVVDMTLWIDYDDGFVAYINEQEVARANMPDGTPDYDTGSVVGHEAGIPEAFNLRSYASYLVSGTNVLSIEIHNTSIGSSDLSMAPELEIESY